MWYSEIWAHHSKTVSVFLGDSLHNHTWKGKTGHSILGYLNVIRQPTCNRWLAEGYPLTLSANVLRTFRKLSILTFWERYLLTLSGLFANVLLTLFCWVGYYQMPFLPGRICPGSVNCPTTTMAIIWRLDTQLNWIDISRLKKPRCMVRPDRPFLTIYSCLWKWVSDHKQTKKSR